MKILYSIDIIPNTHHHFNANTIYATPKQRDCIFFFQFKNAIRIKFSLYIVFTFSRLDILILKSRVICAIRADIITRVTSSKPVVHIIIRVRIIHLLYLLLRSPFDDRRNNIIKNRDYCIDIGIVMIRKPYNIINKTDNFE